MWHREQMKSESRDKKEVSNELATLSILKVRALGQGEGSVWVRVLLL